MPPPQVDVLGRKDKNQRVLYVFTTIRHQFLLHIYTVSQSKPECAQNWLAFQKIQSWISLDLQDGKRFAVNHGWCPNLF